MSKLRSINTVVWSDPWFEVLEPTAKLLFIYLVTNEKTNMLGVYEISIRKVSFETGISSKDINRHLVEFEKSNKIKYEDNRVLLLNFLKHQNYNLNMMKSAIRTYNKLPSGLKVGDMNEVEESREGFLTLCNGFLGVRKYEYEDEVEVEVEVEVESKAKPKKPAKKEVVYRSFKHLSITESDFKKLNKLYSKEQIDNTLDSVENYAKNKSYTSLYLTASKWLRKEYPHIKEEATNDTGGLSEFQQMELKKQELNNNWRNGH